MSFGIPPFNFMIAYKKACVKKAGDRIPSYSIVYKVDDRYSSQVKRMTQATQVLSKTAKDTGDTLQKALNVKDSAQRAAGNLQSVTQQISATDTAGVGLSGTLGKLIQTGGVAIAANTVGDLAGMYFGSAHGDSAGNIASHAVSTAFTGAAIGGSLFPTPVGIAAGAAIGGLLGVLNGAIQTYEKRDNAYKDWYQGLYEHAGSETERMLTAGRSLAQEALGQPEAELNAVQGKLDAAGGEGYYTERNQGIADQIAAYGGELGAALAEANRAMGAGRAAMENLADRYTQEALSSVLTGSETSLQWSDDNAQRLQELGTLYQEAMADYEAGNTEAGALVETYIEEARALAEAQYDSSEAAMGVAEAEKDLITSINENTAALRGWRGDYDVSQAMTKGRAVSSAEDDTFIPGDWSYNADLDPTLQKRAVGIDYVPYDNFPALLHQGERVQTAVEARSQQRIPAITITGNSFSIREDADVDRVASALLQKIELAERRG